MRHRITVNRRPTRTPDGAEMLIVSVREPFVVQIADDLGPPEIVDWWAWHAGMVKHWARVGRIVTEPKPVEWRHVPRHVREVWTERATT